MKWNMEMVIDNITNCIFENTVTGEKFPLDICNVESDVTEIDADKQKLIHTLKNQTIDFSVELMDEIKNFESLCDEYKSSPQYQLFLYYSVQRRKHKKRRINKKWLKKYGYRDFVQMLPIYSDFCYSQQDIDRMIHGAKYAYLVNINDIKVVTDTMAFEFSVTKKFDLSSGKKYPKTRY